MSSTLSISLDVLSFFSLSTRKCDDLVHQHARVKDELIFRLMIIMYL